MEWIRRFFGESCFLNGHIAVGLSVRNDHGHLQAICARCGSEIEFDGDNWRQSTNRATAALAQQIDSTLDRLW